MKRRTFPLYLREDEVESLAVLLYRLQTIQNTCSGGYPPGDEPLRFISQIRRQCCARSGAPDPFPELELSWEGEIAC